MKGRGNLVRETAISPVINDGAPHSPEILSRLIMSVSDSETPSFGILINTPAKKKRGRGGGGGVVCLCLKYVRRALFRSEEIPSKSRRLVSANVSGSLRF